MGDNVFRSVADLVQPLTGGQRRLRHEYPEFPRAWYREWRLRISIPELLQLLHDAPDLTGDRLMNFLLGNDKRYRVVWLTDQHLVCCRSPEATGRTFETTACLWELLVQCDDSPREHYLILEGPRPDPDVVRALHKAVALSSRISAATLVVDDREDFPGVAYPGIEDFVSLARSRRAVKLDFDSLVTSATGRAVAFHCSPLVDLHAHLSNWDDKGEAIAEAIRANRGPTRLTLRNLPRHDHALSSAIEATTTIDELTLYIQDFQSERIYLDSISRNKSIRALVLRKAWYIFCSDVMGIWISLLTSTSIESVDVSEIFEEGPRAFSDDERQECAKVVALLIRFNSCIASIRYDPRTHDAHIMESRVVPILLLNKLRPIFKAWFDGPTNDLDRERTVSAFLGSPFVRRHPQLMYFLLKSAREVLLMPLPSSSGSNQRARIATRRSPRKRGRR